MSNPLDRTEFVDNPEPRCPVILLLDASASMRGEPIAEVNRGLQLLANDLRQDALAALRVEIAVVTVGGAVTLIKCVNGTTTPLPFDAAQAFVTADEFEAPTLVASGDTPLGQGVREALRLLTDRKAIYRTQGVDYFRPWLFLMTDGHPTDDGWEQAAEALVAEEQRRGVLVFPIGVEGANMPSLQKFATRQPMRLNSIATQPAAFREFFSWVSKSLASVAQSRPGEQVALPPVTWAQVDV